MRYPILLLVASLSTALACSSATSTPSGGEPLFDAAPPPTPTSDAGSIGTGHTWTDLYTDYFGNAQRVVCAGNGICHGDANQPGAKDSGGFVCPPNDKDACYKSITDPNVALLTVGDTTSDPKQSQLYQVLRKTSGGGTMPKSPPYQFTQADL